MSKHNKVGVGVGIESYILLLTILISGIRPSFSVP